jgi:hypothetical protein
VLRQRGESENGVVVLEQRRETNLGAEKREKTEERERGVELTGL